MADLVTHLCTVLIPATARPKLAGPLAVGVVLPDVAARVPAIAIERLTPVIGMPPWWVFQVFDPFHMPAGILLMAALLAWLFPERERWFIFVGLILGGTAHLALDLLQNHHQHGYPLFFPFSRATFELGWLGTEQTVFWAPWLVVLTAGTWGVRWGVGWLRRTSTGPDTPQG